MAPLTRMWLALMLLVALPTETPVVQLAEAHDLLVQEVAKVGSAFVDKIRVSGEITDSVLQRVSQFFRQFLDKTENFYDSLQHTGHSKLAVVTGHIGKPVASIAGTPSLPLVKTPGRRTGSVIRTEPATGTTTQPPVRVTLPNLLHSATSLLPILQPSDLLHAKKRIPTLIQSGLSNLVPSRVQSKISSLTDIISSRPTLPPLFSLISTQPGSVGHALAASPEPASVTNAEEGSEGIGLQELINRVMETFQTSGEPTEAEILQKDDNVETSSASETVAGQNTTTDRPAKDSSEDQNSDGDSTANYPLLHNLTGNGNDDALNILDDSSDYDKSTNASSGQLDANDKTTNPNDTDITPTAVIPEGEGVTIALTPAGQSLLAQVQDLLAEGRQQVLGSNRKRRSPDPETDGNEPRIWRQERPVVNAARSAGGYKAYVNKQIFKIVTQRPIDRRQLLLSPYSQQGWAPIYPKISTLSPQTQTSATPPTTHAPVSPTDDSTGTLVERMAQIQTSVAPSLMDEMASLPPVSVTTTQTEVTSPTPPPTTASTTEPPTTTTEPPTTTTGTERPTSSQLPVVVEATAMDLATALTNVTEITTDVIEVTTYHPPLRIQQRPPKRRIPSTLPDAVRPPDNSKRPGLRRTLGFAGGRRPDPSRERKRTVGSTSSRAPLPASSRAPVSTPSRAPDPAPSRAPDPAPSRVPDPAPSRAPVPAPSRAPVPTPSLAPVSAPSRTPVPDPSQAPVPAPSRVPDPAPSRAPVSAPSRAPVPAPSRAPVPAPSRAPVPAPSLAPLPAPSRTPVPAPSRTPVPDPSQAPVPDPSQAPVPAPRAPTPSPRRRTASRLPTATPARRPYHALATAPPVQPPPLPPPFAARRPLYPPPVSHQRPAAGPSGRPAAAGGRRTSMLVAGLQSGPPTSIVVPPVGAPSPQYLSRRRDWTLASADGGRFDRRRPATRPDWSPPAPAAAAAAAAAASRLPGSSPVTRPPPPPQRRFGLHSLQFPFFG